MADYNGIYIEMPFGSIRPISSKASRVSLDLFGVSIPAVYQPTDEIVQYWIGRNGVLMNAAKQIVWKRVSDRKKYISRSEDILRSYSILTYYKGKFVASYSSQKKAENRSVAVDEAAENKKWDATFRKNMFKGKDGSGLRNEKFYNKSGHSILSESQAAQHIVPETSGSDISVIIVNRAAHAAYLEKNDQLRNPLTGKKNRYRYKTISFLMADCSKMMRKYADGFENVNEPRTIW